MKIRIVDLDALLNTLYDYYPEYWEDVMEKFPTLDAVPVVRCKDCFYAIRWNKRWERPKREDWMWCKRFEDTRQTDWFCADGERKDGADDETV